MAFQGLTSSSSQSSSGSSGTAGTWASGGVGSSGTTAPSWSPFSSGRSGPSDWLSGEDVSGGWPSSSGGRSGLSLSVWLERSGREAETGRGEAPSAALALSRLERKNAPANSNSRAHTSSAGRRLLRFLRLRLRPGPPLGRTSISLWYIEKTPSLPLLGLFYQGVV